MRRDLKRGCATCRLRFSEQFKYCPVCQDIATFVLDATSRVQPTARAEWIAKWVIVLSSIPAIGAVAWSGISLLKDGWPPKNALDIILFVFGGMGTALGASVVVAVPFAIWFGVVNAFRFVLRFLVDRPQRTLRVSIERVPRLSRHTDHFMHRLWDKLTAFVDNQIAKPTRVILVCITVIVGGQILAEIFGSHRHVKTTSLNEFGQSMVMLVIIDFMSAAMFGFFVSVFGSIASIARKFLAKPPHLFGFDLQPPALQNETCLESFIRGRHEVIGHAAKLDEVERAALRLQNESPLQTPLSGQTCLAFRLVGQAHEQPVDDADASAFVVVTKDAKRCIVTTSDVVVAFAAETKVQAENAHGFLKERGLPERNLALREGLLREGDLVRVVGRRTEIRVGAAGYRGNERRAMLDAVDGLPVVILPPNETTS